MKQIAMTVAAGLMCAALWGREVTLGNVLCNPGGHFTVPILLDDVSDVAAISLHITYEPTVLVLTAVKPGTLREHFAAEFSVEEAPGSVEIMTFGRGQSARTVGGSVAELCFTARPGSEAMTSGLTIANAHVWERTVTEDLSVNNPLVPKSGVLTSASTAADCRARLGEGSLTVAAETAVRALALEAGDALCLSSAQRPIVVSEALTATGALRLLAPEGGWTTARYEVLQAPVAGLTLTLEDPPEDYTLSEETSGGVTTYVLTASVADEVPIRTEDTLSAEDAQGIRALLGDQLSGVTEIIAQGSQEAIELGVDLGIAPETTRSGSTLTATFTLPQLAVVGFDPQSGIIRVRVEPGEGSLIKGTIVTGVLHVHGAETLGGTWSELPEITVDLSAYQSAETLGEFQVTAQLGRHTFIKVIAGRSSALTPSTSEGTQE
ncbi:MAG: cohesin domain-containing protein [Candidatus Spyradenecus sp.]